MRSILPILLSAMVLGACTSSSQSTAPASAPAASAATFTHAIQGRETAVGSFTGASKHVTTGHASVFRADGKWFISLASDFFHDGSPDPKIAFGNNGFRQEAIISPLTSLTGAQVYEIPSTLDVGDYNEIWLWCEKFAVPLGVAPLTLT